MSNDRPKFFLLGVSGENVAILFGGDSIEDLEEFGKPLKYYSIFANRVGFWGSVQKEYLVASKDDPVWGQRFKKMSVN